MASEGYKHAGDVEVESATLILSNKQVVDISELVTEVNIYQDLFNHYIEAEFVMDDSFNLFGEGCNGTEIVEISFRNMVGSGVNTKFIRHVLNVYEVSDKQRISEFREVYIMNCVSAEKYLTTPTKISRAYGPSLISDMISKINSEFVYNNDAKDFYRELSSIFNYTKSKTGVIDKTSGQQQLIIPNMPVDDAIDFLSTEADSDDHIPFYTFYEDADGFNFRNVSNLTQQEAFLTFHHLPTATDLPESDLGGGQNDFLNGFDDTFKIIAYNVVKQNNILKNTNDGLYRQKTLNLDIQRRSSKEVVYDYDEYGNKFKSIENKILGGAEGEPIYNLMTTRKGHDSDETLSAENHFPKRINETKQITRGYQRSLFNVVMEVTVAGNDEINVGQVIELMFYRTIDDIVSLDTYDKYLSGNYLITKVRQKLTGAKSGVDYVTVIECTRDGIREN